ncbi:MAG: hypothetical protein KAR20_29995 [Candidatus Heimdallarchaeota archaeon]|nr:hypothetical protein [Candidatus Heimdallarchaeota archaeon]
MTKYRAYIPEISLECDAENEYDAKQIIYKKLLRKIEKEYENEIILWKPIDYIDENGNNVLNDE